MSSNYRCVNFYDLCRLCTACTEQKIHIFSSEGKMKNLSTKIAECLPLVVDEKDRLPKILCPQCVQHVENIAEFRNICKNSQTMLNSCLNTATAQNGGKVYIKDAVAAASGRSQSVLGNVSNALNINATSISTPTLVSTPTTLQTLVNQSVAGVANSNILQSNDFLSSIMQAVGLQSSESVQSDKPQVVQQYTITLDNKGGFKTEPMEYKITANPTVTSIPTSTSTAAPITQSGTVQSYNSEKESRHNALEEFLKMKPNIKVTPIKKKQQQPTKQQESTIQQQQQQQQPTLPLQTSVQQQFHPQQQQQIQQQQYTQVTQLQLQQLQQQLQQQFQQQHLQQQLQNITAQLQPQHPQQITITGPAVSSDALSPSKNKKPKLNFVLTSPTSQTLSAPQPQIQLQLQHAPVQQHHPQQQSAASTLLQNLAPFLQQQQQQISSQSHQQSTMLSPNKCFLPITIKDENSDQQIVAHIDAKNFMLPTTYQLQMKLQPQIATVDGQPIMHLTPTSIPATLQIAPQTLSNQTFQAAAANQIQQQLQMQQTLQQQQQQQQQTQQQSPLQHVQITSQQIIQAGTKTINKIGTHNNSNTHDAATSTSDQLDEVFTTTNNNLQSTEQSIKPPQKYRITQHTGSNTIEITPTRNLTQQIMQQVQQQQQKSQQQQNLTTTTGTVATKTTTTLPTQHGGITVQRITTTKAAAAKTQQQHPKLPVLGKQNVTISRITPQQQQKQQQQQQQQQQLQLQPQQQKPVATTTQQQIKLPQQQQKVVSTSVNQQPTLQQNRVTTAVKNKLSPTKKVVRPSRPTTTTTAAAATTTTETIAASAKSQTSSTSTVTYQQTVGDTGGAVVVSNGTENFTVVTLPAAHGVGPEGLECSQCGRIFKKKEHLTQHLKLHAGVRPFKCNEEGCEKDFSRKEHLLRHIISHTGKKMFSCEVCQKLFSRKDNLNKHKRMHSDQPSSNNYTCEICHKVFAIKIYYEQHKSIHEKDKIAAAVTKLDKEKVLQKTPHQVQQQQTITVSQQTPHQHQHHQQIQIVQQQAQPSYTQLQAQPNHTQQQQQQHQPQQQIMHLQLPAGVVTTQDLANNTITITQSSDPNNPNSVKAIGSHDATVLNLPTSLANFVQLGQAQFVNATTGEIMGHIKIEK